MKLKGKDPENKINYSFTKLFQPTQNTEKRERLFTFTSIPNHRFQ